MTDNDDQSTNLGNFRAILNYRSEGDDCLKNHLEQQGRNKYITPQVQNEIISACEDIILKEIVREVNSSRCFTVLADETTDISVTEQLSLCVRYVDLSNNIKENFLKFIPVYSLTGKNLAESIISGK